LSEVGFRVATLQFSSNQQFSIGFNSGNYRATDLATQCYSELAIVLQLCGLCLRELLASNGAVYLDALKEKLPSFMTIHGCDKLQQDSPPCQQTKDEKQWQTQNDIELLGPWRGNFPDLNPVENSWSLLKHN